MDQNYYKNRSFVQTPPVATVLQKNQINLPMLQASPDSFTKYNKHSLKPELSVREALLSRAIFAGEIKDIQIILASIRCQADLEAMQNAAASLNEKYGVSIEIGKSLLDETVLRITFLFSNTRNQIILTHNSSEAAQVSIGTWTVHPKRTKISAVEALHAFQALIY